MAGFLEQYMNHISNDEKHLNSLIPHYYGKDSLANRTRSNGCIVWERANANNNVVDAKFAMQYAKQFDKKFLYGRKHVVDIHSLAISEEICDEILNAELSVLMDNSNAVNVELQNIVYKERNAEMKVADFWQIARVVIVEPVYANPNMKATITGFQLQNGTTIPNQDGWIDALG